MTETERRSIIERAFIVTLDADGYEDYTLRPGRVPEATLLEAHRLIRRRERLLSRMVTPRPTRDAIRVWHLLAINKVQLQAVAAKGSPVEAYLTRGTRTNDNTREVLASRERDSVDEFKAHAPARVFDQIYEAAIRDWPDRDWR